MPSRWSCTPAPCRNSVVEPAITMSAPIKPFRWTASMLPDIVPLQPDGEIGGGGGGGGGGTLGGTGVVGEPGGAAAAMLRCESSGKTKSVSPNMPDPKVSDLP